MDVEQRRKWIWFLAVAGLVGAASVVGWKFALPAYRHHKELRSLRQARDFLQKGDYPNGVLALRGVLAINSSNREAVSLMADLASSAQSPGALAWWRRLVELDPSTAHKLRYAATALRVEKRPFPIASQVVEELAVIGKTNLAYHLVASQLALQMGRLDEAAAHFEMAVQLDPTNRLHQLNLATVRLNSATAAVKEASRREIASLASDPQLAAVALRLLTAEALQREGWAEAQNFSERLLALPQVTIEDRVQHLSLLKQAGSPDLPSKIEETERLAATNSIQASQMLAWLNANEKPVDALAWAGTLAPDIRSAPSVALMEAQSYMSLKDWAGLENRLTDQRWDEQEFLRLAMLSRALREQGRREIAAANWRRARISAETRLGMLATLVQVTGGWNWNEEKEELLWTIVKRAPGEEWAWRSLIQSRTAAGDIEGVYKVATAKLERKPDLDATNNVACIDLLLNRNLPQAIDLARQCYESGRTNALYVSTYAFALYKQGKTAEGLKLIESLPENVLQRPDIALYYVVLLNASGQREKAAPYIALAEKGQMFPEEKQLLAGSQGK